MGHKNDENHIPVVRKVLRYAIDMVRLNKMLERLAESLRKIRSRPLVHPKWRCFSLQMLVIAGAMTVLCASISTFLVTRSGALEFFPGSDSRAAAGYLSFFTWVV